jgi:hypothetical protein
MSAIASKYPDATTPSIGKQRSGCIRQIWLKVRSHQSIAISSARRALPSIPGRQSCPWRGSPIVGGRNSHLRRISDGTCGERFHRRDVADALSAGIRSVPHSHVVLCGYQSVPPDHVENCITQYSKGDQAHQFHPQRSFRLTPIACVGKAASGRVDGIPNPATHNIPPAAPIESGSGKAFARR